VLPLSPGRALAVPDNAAAGVGVGVALAVAVAVGAMVGLAVTVAVGVIVGVGVFLCGAYPFAPELHPTAANINVAANAATPTVTRHAPSPLCAFQRNSSGR
jgi:hypothetical protein